MKKTVAFLACSIALTLVFYLLADYLLPGPSPSATMVLLFAGIAMVLVWLVQCFVRVSRAKKGGAHTVVLLVGVLAGLLAAHLCGCSRAPTATPAPPSPQEVATPSGGGAAAMPRVTGTALLASGQKEEQGFGLYSYALLSHPPADGELPRYQAFFKALLGLPEAGQLGKYLPKARINVTYIPIIAVPGGWEQLAAEKRVDYVLAHYDYARGAAMLATLSKATGHGPVIISVLQPLDVASHPHPVLVQDLSKAQATLMDSYVAEFVSQAAQGQFWQPNALQAFALSLRNVLETAATGLGMSQTAVMSWVKFFK
ncbi:MAG TPA: hypothetical protein VMA71_06585 [Alloacidobacterium sp.]|nr:hypothetical protein [Alloacidobacterium sp.]